MNENDNHKNSTRIFIGLIIGAVLGAIFNLWGENPTREWILNYMVQPIGQAFLRALFMIVVPLVFSSLLVGIVSLGSVSHVGRLGWRLGSFYVLTTLAAIGIGQFLVALVRPGDGVPIEFVNEAQSALSGQVANLMESSHGVFSSLWPGIISAIIPKNIPASLANGDMLSIIFVAILFGVALLRIEPKKSSALVNPLEAVSQASVVIIHWIMKTAPLAVAALIMNSISRLGIGLMANVAKFVMVVLLGYLLQILLTYAGIIKFVLRLPLIKVFQRFTPALATGFSTSSSNATIPTTMKTLEDNLGVPKSITTFSVPLGATVNMDGTALFEAVAALFVAQVFHVHLDMMAQFSLVFLLLCTSIGVAGVPGGSIPILMSVMAVTGIPPEGIALILGVDRLLDMGRTVVNITGDMVGALYLSKVEAVPIKEYIENKAA